MAYFILSASDWYNKIYPPSDLYTLSSFNRLGTDTPPQNWKSQLLVPQGVICAQPNSGAEDQSLRDQMQNCAKFIQSTMSFTQGPHR